MLTHRSKIVCAALLSFVAASAAGNTFTLTKEGSQAAVCEDATARVSTTGAIEVDVASCSIWVNTGTDPKDTGEVDTTKDPGVGSGLWVPAGETDLFVVDQSIGNGVKTTTSYIPGCINGRDYWKSNCKWAAKVQDTVLKDRRRYSVATGPGQIVSVRYQPDPNMGKARRYPVSILVAGVDGGTIGRPTDVSLSSSPGDFSDPSCSRYAEGGISRVNIGPKFCELSTATKIYYLNIRAKAACADRSCVYQVTNGAKNEVN